MSVFNKRIIARFIGNTSCGFVTGKVYELEIYTDSKWVWVKDRKGPAQCPYSSIRLLAQNWEIPANRNAEEKESPVSNRIFDD